MAPSPPPDGLYAPLPAFFDSMDELDLESYAQHTKYVSAAGVIPVVSATIGEAVHLDRNERIRLIRTARSVLDENNLRETPVVAGVGATSTRETIALAEDAAAAGASFVLVAAPGYYAGVLRSSPSAVKDFFVDVASRSPLPLIIYNYPVIAGGIDLSSNDIVEIAKAAPNVRGAMLSCGNVGKVSRILSQLDESFKTFAGFIDFLLPSVVVGSAGAISPIPNVVPNLAMELWRSTQTLEGKADYGKARRLQETASLAEAELLSGGIPGIKHLLGQRFGYPAAPRRPLPSVSEAVAVRLSNSEYLKDV